MAGEQRRHEILESLLTATSLLIVIFFLLIPTSNAIGKDGDRYEDEGGKLVVVTNNHTNYLSIRCFSFDDEFNVTHLKPWEQFKFTVHVRKIFPSATMFNCSTNMGTFVAFKYNYRCAREENEICNWRFDEDNVYKWNSKSTTWELYNYDPNYESLTRGGVIKGYFAN